MILAYPVEAATISDASVSDQRLPHITFCLFQMSITESRNVDILVTFAQAVERWPKWIRPAIGIAIGRETRPVVEYCRFNNAVILIGIETSTIHMLKNIKQFRGMIGAISKTFVRG